MKRIGLIIACMSLFMLLSGTVVWAGVSISEGTITLSDNCTTSGLAYQMSPNVIMGYVDVPSVDGYVISSVNSKGSMAYAIQSHYSGYYQKEVTVGQTAAPTTDNATIVGNTWTKVTF